MKKQLLLLALVSGLASFPVSSVLAAETPEDIAAKEKKEKEEKEAKEKEETRKKDIEAKEKQIADLEKQKADLQKEVKDLKGQSCCKDNKVKNFFFGTKTKTGITATVAVLGTLALITYYKDSIVSACSSANNQADTTANA